MKNRLYTRLKNSRIDMDKIVATVCVILAITLLSAPVLAQTQISATDDFEDQNSNGWVGPSSSVVNQGYDGSYSLRQDDGYGTTADDLEPLSWESQGNLDLSQQFTIEGTSYSSPGDSNFGTRVGLINDNDRGAMIAFSFENGNTVLTDTGTNSTATPEQSINQDFANTWVNFEITSEGTGNIQAKVWEAGTTEPTEYQMSRDFNQSVTAPVGINAGFDEDGDRYIQLDDISVQGTATSDPTLRLDTGNYLGYGETQEYTVYDLQGENDIRVDVTENTTVTSGTPSVITVDESENTLTATNDENVSTRVYITATYNGRTDIQQVTVAEQSIENLDVLPFLGRTGAMFLDRGFQMILVGLLLAIAATRTGGVYAGLGIYQMSLTVGWLIGWVPIGLALVGLFTTLFIGLNIAANIDYSVRR